MNTLHPFVFTQRLIVSIVIVVIKAVIFFNTLETGNITNRVIAGSDLTGNITSASNTTQVLGNDTVVEENVTQATKTIIDNNKTTGNPIIVLLLALFAIIPLRGLKNKI
jgi:hypothetical protein